MKKFKILLPLFLAVSLLLSGCSSTSSSSTPAATGEGQYLIYGLDADLSSLITTDFVPSDGTDVSSMSDAELVDALLSALATETSDLTFIYPIRDFSVNSYDFDETAGSLTIDFDHAYLEQNSLTEVLNRAAIVETLCQVSTVSKVTFTVEGHPLTDEDGNEVGGMTASQFISSSRNEINSVEKVQLTLYFANETGDKLVRTYRTTYYNTNIALERLITERVIQGPNIDTVYPTVNPETKVLSVTTRDSVCYVNLDESFLTDPYNVSAQVAVYSLVNSLCELSSVSKVQISINGSTSETFLDTIPLSTVFEQNPTLITEAENAEGTTESTTESTE